MKFSGYNSVKSWGIALASSIVACLALLPSRTSGMLFVAFLSHYKTNRQNAFFCAVIIDVVSSLTSPLIGYLAEIFEVRTLIITGSFFSSAGVGLCYFAKDVTTATISLGFLSGIGYSLQINILPLIIKQHFTKSISTAYGVIWIGSSIGSFLVIPVVKILLDVYGVPGALLISCGIMLHGVPVAMLLQDPKYKEAPISLLNKQSNGKGKESGGDFVKDSNYSGNTVTNNHVIENNKTYFVEESNATSTGCMSKENKVNSISENVINSNEHSLVSNNQPMVNISLQSSINLNKGAESVLNSEQIFSKQNLDSERSPIAKKQNKYIAALKTLAILGNPPFLVIMFSLGVYIYIDTIIYAVVIDIARDKGVLQGQEQLFIILIQMVQIVGYISLGWVTDKGYLTAARFHAVGFFCIFLSCCGFIFSNSSTTMMVPVVLFGISASMYTIGSPSLVYEYVEKTHQSMAIASRFVLNAPLCLTMGPTLHYFRDTLGSYDGVLCLLAASSLICAALLLLLPWIARCTSRKKTCKNEE